MPHLFDTHGHLTYGEGVTQLQHALQCATLAAQAHASDGLVLATFLHDIGHMQHPDAAGDLEQGRDGTHEALGADFLARWFGPDVSEPVRLHVQAKRYLCQGSSDYLNQLSPTSVRTLRLQGGPMTPQEALAFEQHPYRDDALRLRRWDDSGKEANIDTLPMAHFMQLAAQHAAEFEGLKRARRSTRGPLLGNDLPPPSRTKVMAVGPQILENCGYEDHTIYR